MLLEIARLAPEARFLVVAAQVSRARVEEQVERAGLENVEIRDWTADTGGLYKEAREYLALRSKRKQFVKDQKQASLASANN